MCAHQRGSVGFKPLLSVQRTCAFIKVVDQLRSKCCILMIHIVLINMHGDLPLLVETMLLQLDFPIG